MATDQEIRDAGFLYIPKQKYLQNPYNLPIAPVPPPPASASGGITNTNAFVNSGGDGGGETRYDNSFLPGPRMTYIDMVRKYGSDSKQAEQMLEKAGGTYPGGNYMTEGGFEYTNSFPDTFVQMQDLNYNPTVSSTGNVLSNYNRMGGYLDEGSQITGNPVGVGTGSPVTNFKGVSIAPSFNKSGVRTVNSNLSTVANPDIFSTHGTALSSPFLSKSNPMFEGKKGFENYSESAFEEEEEENKQSFIANMISRARQIGSSLPGWARGVATAMGGPFAAAASFLGGGKNYEQFDPRGSFRGGVYTIDGVNYANPSQVNEGYDPVTGTNRFDRATPGSFASYRTLADYFGRNNDNDNDNTSTSTSTSTGKSYDADPGGTVERGPNQNPGEGEGGQQNDGQNNAGDSSERGDGSWDSSPFAKGGRAGYFFGGRVNYKIGGRVGFKNGGLASIL